MSKHKSKPNILLNAISLLTVMTLIISALAFRYDFIDRLTDHSRGRALKLINTNNTREFDTLLTRTDEPEKVINWVFIRKLEDDNDSSSLKTYQHLTQKMIEYDSLSQWHISDPDPIELILLAPRSSVKSSLLQGSFGKHLAKKFALDKPQPKSKVYRRNYLYWALAKNDLTLAKSLVTLGMKLSDKTNSRYFEAPSKLKSTFDDKQEPYAVIYGCLFAIRSDKHSYDAQLKWLEEQSIDWNFTRKLPIYELPMNSKTVAIEKPFGHELIEAVPDEDVLTALDFLDSVGHDFRLREQLIDAKGNKTPGATISEVLTRIKSKAGLEWIAKKTKAKTTH